MDGSANSRLFTLRDVTSERSDLAARKEFKFLLPHADIGKLRRLLTSKLRSVVFHRRTSLVRSVYFDDVSMTACRANLDGWGEREKFRLRWYDSALPGQFMVAEIKWRRNRVTGKRRYELRADQPLAQVPSRQLLQELAEQIPPTEYATLCRLPDPTVLVEYSREHFQSMDGEVRFTIDYGIRFYDQTLRVAVVRRFGVTWPEVVLIEAKVPPGMERRIPELLYPFAVRACRCSKYVQGCQLLGLA